jgi:macrolide transport system ATP-binding/permease protein
MLFQDLRSACRSLVKTPTLTLAVVLSLGLGIGANTTVFSWVQAVLLRPVPGAVDPDALFVANLQTREGRSRSWSYPNYRDVRDRARLIDFVAQDDVSMSIAVDTQAERAYGGLVSGNYFQVMGVQPALGRLLTSDDDRSPGGHPVAVISHAYWLNRFAGDPSIVGREVTINSTPMTIVGVAQPKFAGSFLGVAAAAWVPMAMQPQMAGGSRLEIRGSSWAQTYVRLHDGVTRDQAQAELSAIVAQLAQEYREINDGIQVRVARPWEAQFGASAVLAPILAVLSIVVALVLVIACANVANLLLARAVGRRREIAVRLSLGASRWRLVRQLLIESLLLAMLAGTLGVVLAYWTSGVLMAFAPPTDMPIDLGLTVDRWTLAYAAVVSIATGLVFGLAPAWQASRPTTVHALKEEAGRGTSGGRTTQRLRSGLVVAQVAVCLVLLIGAGLFTRSLSAAEHMSPGFEPRGLLIASLDLFPNGYSADTGRRLHRQLVERVALLPNVARVAIARQVPLGLSGSSSMRASIAGYAARPDEELVFAYNSVGPGYFETMQIPIVRGREFAATDTNDAQKVVIVNETMARRYWTGRDALGGGVQIGKDSYVVVGIARDSKYAQIAEPPQPYMYLPMEQIYSGTTVLHVRSAGPSGPVMASIRQLVRELDPNLPIFDARTMEEHMRTAVFAQKMGANMLGAMGVLALVLAAVGLYGVIAYAVSQRTQEMGIRLALGAAPGDLLRMVLGQGLLLTIVGLAVGLVLALVATGFMRTLLPGIGPRDPLTFVGVPAVLVAIAAIAAFIPARRAGAVDPIVALRYE